MTNGLPIYGAMLEVPVLCNRYLDAQAKVNSIRKQVTALGEKGNHKVKNKIINEQLRKATIIRNEAMSSLQNFLDRIAANRV